MKMPLVLALGVLAAVAPQVPVFRSGVELVRIEVSVTRGGRPVGGLSFDDFEVRDNDVVQTLNSVLLEQVPLDVYFVLDMSQSVTGTRLADLRRAAGAFMDGLTAEDRAALVCFSQQVALNEPLTGDLARVRRTLETISGTGSTAMRDALYAAIRLHEAGDHRAAAIVFSDGIDNLSWLREDDVVESARRSDVVVYGVLTPQPSSNNGFLERVTERGRQELAGHLRGGAAAHPEPLPHHLLPAGRHGGLAHAQGAAEAGPRRRARATGLFPNETCRVRWPRSLTWAEEHRSKTCATSGESGQAGLKACPTCR